MVNGDRRKLLVNYDDTFCTLVSKCSKAVECTKPNPILIAGGTIIGEDSFRNVGHYMAVAHLKPGKVEFGIVAGTRDIDICYTIHAVYAMKASFCVCIGS